MFSAKILLCCYLICLPPTLLLGSGGWSGSSSFTSSALRISNLNDTCLRCLCHVVGCDVSRGCTEDGYCGPFYLSRVYWADAGKVTQPEDDVNRKEAFKDCAKDYHCSLRIVKNYMATFGKDCNNDGVTDCMDYMMINFNGGRVCSTPLRQNEHGRKWLTSFKQCRL